MLTIFRLFIFRNMDSSLTSNYLDATFGDDMSIMHELASDKIGVDDNLSTNDNLIPYANEFAIPNTIVFDFKFHPPFFHPGLVHPMQGSRCRKLRNSRLLNGLLEVHSLIHTIQKKLTFRFQNGYHSFIFLFHYRKLKSHLHPFFHLEKLESQF